METLASKFLHRAVQHIVPLIASTVKGFMVVRLYCNLLAASELRKLCASKVNHDKDWLFLNLASYWVWKLTVPSKALIEIEE